MSCRILYFRGGILEETEELAREDIVEAARTASSKHPDLMAEVWHDGRKAAVVRPALDRHSSYEIELRRPRLPVRR